MHPTTQARTLVVHDNKLLLLRCHYADGDRWVLPGGTQEFGETLEECARRETKEETNLDVTIIRPLYLQEVITKKHGVVLYYLAKLVSDPADITHRNDPDLNETRIRSAEWVPLTSTALPHRQPEVIEVFLADKAWQADEHCLRILPPAR